MSTGFLHFGQVMFSADSRKLSAISQKDDRIPMLLPIFPACLAFLLPGRPRIIQLGFRVEAVPCGETEQDRAGQHLTKNCWTFLLLSSNILIEIMYFQLGSRAVQVVGTICL